MRVQLRLTSSEQGGDIHIIGRDHRNRAVHGDRVAVERIRADVPDSLSISRDGGDSDEENEEEVTAALLPAVEGALQQ